MWEIWCFARVLCFKGTFASKEALKTRLNLFLEDVLSWPRPPAQVLLPGAERRRLDWSSEEMLHMLLLLLMAAPSPGAAQREFFSSLSPLLTVCSTSAPTQQAPQAKPVLLQPGKSTSEASGPR